MPLIFVEIRSILADLAPMCPVLVCQSTILLPICDVTGVSAYEKCESFVLGDFTTEPLATRLDAHVDASINDSIPTSNNSHISGLWNQLTPQCL